MSTKGIFKYSKEFLQQAVLEAHAKKGGEIVNEKDVGQNIAQVIHRRYGGWANFLVELGLRPFKGERERLLPEVIRLYQEERLSMAEIGKRLGYTKGAIQDWLEKAGVETRTTKDYDLVNWEREPTKFLSYGYVMVRFPGQQNAIPEHRLVMEKKLGRKLERNEIVHHLNAIKDDNREENLVVVTRPTHPLNSKDTYRGMLQARIRELEEQLRNC